ncbi:MAG: 4-hydroxythreonine-4-phosphate dehydrogenase PdxA [Betaproteobacteria bacterium]|nr:4-hydroxythreonine-4-phosphate dehydrogenase PdxA [Betaproteobacteria bacterium]
MIHLALSTGEPAGIGPDVCLMIAANTETSLLQRGVILQLIGDRELLQSRAHRLGLTLSPAQWSHCLHVPLAVPAQPGVLDARNAGYVLQLLDEAVQRCNDGRCAAMVTAPVQKSVINDAGIAFTGHTEYLADKAACDVVMMLAAGGLRVALATTHLALSAVPAAITIPLLTRVLRIIDSDLRRSFGIARPRILMAGLNPHSGEGGHLGREDIEVLQPALQQARAAGIQVEGPLPADTLFTPRVLQGADCVLAMYHDQGLPVLKYAGFGEAVNITLGLPYIRTSVDHGTALDLAGSGRADAGSLQAAIDIALEMVRHRAIGA